MDKKLLVLYASDLALSINRETKEVFLEFRLAPQSAPYLPDHHLVLGLSTSEALQLAQQLASKAREAEGAGPPN